jgi:L-rhamnonate dehydratase
MKIVDVEAIVLQASTEIDEDIADGSQDALVIKVTTDEGIVGYGEVDSSPTVVRAVVGAPSSHKLCRGLRSMLLGANPLQPEVIWDKLFEGSLYYGRRGVVIHAISGIEIALWDICGKALGVPVCALLGGQRRSKVKAYASTLMPDSEAAVRDVVDEQMAAGFKAIKLGYGPLGLDMRRDVALLAAARDAAGEDVDLMLDIGLAWHNVHHASACVRAMEELRPYWIEEPFAPDELEKYRQLSEAVNVPIAAGEQESSLSDFERLVVAGVGVLQPDVTRAGGMRQCLRVADLAFRQGRRCVLHAWSTGIIKAASLHVTAAMREAEYFEYCVQSTELNRHLTKNDFPIHDGCVDVPDGPGLGVDIDEDFLAGMRVA